MKPLGKVALAALICALVVGCPRPAVLLWGLASGIGTGGDVSQSALNYGGTLSGAVAGSSSTAAANDPQAAQSAPLTSAAVAWLTDLEGNRLRDENGQLYPEFPLSGDGTFDMTNLPVGVEIVVVVDLDGDGQADLTSIITIPKDAGSNTGTLTGVNVDPLSTLSDAKLKQLMAAQNVTPGDLDFSLSGLIGRTRDGYENLLDDAGIEDEVELDEIADLGRQQLAEYFTDYIPLPAQRGMRMAESNIALAIAEDLEEIVQAVAQILIEGGFVIADDPGGIDLSFLGDLAHVESLTFEQFDEFFGPPGPDEPAPRGVPPDFAQTAPMPPGEPVLYVNMLAEPDRNFTMAGDEEQPLMTKPMFAEHMLIEIAQAYLDDLTISLGDLYRLMVDIDIGMGARLTYSKWGGPDQPPVDVFESADGTGVEKNLFELFQQLERLGMAGPPDPDQMEQQEAAVRRILKDFLAGTAEPAFERLLGGFLMERVSSAGEFARFVRNRRVHLPFSRSGPSQWFVIADADPWQNPDARAITVDVETDADGRVTSVTLNPGFDGKFYLGHGPITEAGMETELIRRSNGQFLHDHQGRPQFLEMSNSSIFQNVGGQTFFEAFSETGEHYPGAPALRFPNFGFDPTLPPDPETNPPDWEAFVLVTEPGPDGIPVRINYADGVATYNENGQYYLLFDERTEEGLFALIEETGELLEQTAGDWESRVLVAALNVQGIDLAPERFTFIYGIEVPNQGYDADGAPYYDDINENGVQDAGEPTFAEKHFLFDPADWRSTWVEKHYRRVDNNGFPDPEDVDWESATPALRNGVALVPRNFRPRLNGFLFARPNTALNLLMAFSPPEFYNGTQALDRDTRVNPLMAVAIIDLVFEQAMNVEATVDWDGPGGMPEHDELVPAWFFVAPIGDPVALIADGFRNLAE